MLVLRYRMSYLFFLFLQWVVRLSASVCLSVHYRCYIGCRSTNTGNQVLLKFCWMVLNPIYMGLLPISYKDSIKFYGSHESSKISITSSKGYIAASSNQTVPELKVKVILNKHCLTKLWENFCKPSALYSDCSVSLYYIN